jgi:hypothetical protein
MAMVPTASDIRSILEGYCISSAIISDSVIERLRDKFVINWIETKTGLSMSGEKQYTQYYNGNGKNELFLNIKNVISLDSVEYVIGGDVISDLSLTQFVLDGPEGIIKAIRTDLVTSSANPVFRKGRKNIKITFTVGFEADEIPESLTEGILYLTAEKVLSQIEGRGGGGDVSLQGFSKSYGNRGKYTHIRNELARMGLALINDYFNAVVGD